MAIVRANGFDFDVEQSGEGPHLVLLHSLLTDRSSFAAIAPGLSRIRRVTLVSLPGFGATSAGGPGIEDLADRIGDLVGAFGGADVLGNGFGGFIALALAARHGSMVGRLVLADAGATFPEEGRATFRAMAEAVERVGMGAIVDGALRRIFPEAFLATHPEAAAERKRVLLAADAANFAAACRALARVELREALPRIANPTLVVVGALDAATPPAMARQLAASIAGARLVEIPGCGHCPPLQEPQAFLDVVVPFLQGSAASSTAPAEPSRSRSPRPWPR